MYFLIHRATGSKSIANMVKAKVRQQQNELQQHVSLLPYQLPWEKTQC